MVSYRSFCESTLGFDIVSFSAWQQAKHRVDRIWAFHILLWGVQTSRSILEHWSLFPMPSSQILWYFSMLLHRPFYIGEVPMMSTRHSWGVICNKLSSISCDIVNQKFVENHDGGLFDPMLGVDEFLPYLFIIGDTCGCRHDKVDKK